MSPTDLLFCLIVMGTTPVPEVARVAISSDPKDPQVVVAAPVEGGPALSRPGVPEPGPEKS